jgi:hypothetical protein
METQIRINRRAWLLNNLEKVIEESVYYRSYSFEMKPKNRISIFNFKDSSGKGNIK